MVAVVGDIHGCYYTLLELIKKVKQKYPGIIIYSVGDLVDRGNFSYEVIEFIISEKIRFTPGNHDYMFYYFVKEPASQLGRAWLYNGSESTIASYGNHVDKIGEHLDLIINAPLFIGLKDCFISHAGISNYFHKKLTQKILENNELLDQFFRNNIASEHGILWTRDDLMNIGRLQLVGHTRQQDVIHNASNVVYIDTSVYTGNKLSAVIVENNIVLDVVSVPTLEIDIQ